MVPDFKILNFVLPMEHLRDAPRLSPYLETSKRVAIYESLAYELMKLETPNKCDALLNEIISSIKGNQ